MSAVLTEQETQILIEQRVVLHNVSWESYESLMKSQEDSSAPRFTYDGGELEIYLPSQKHEKSAEFLTDIVKTIAEEREIEVLSLGSTTFKRENVRRGVEPDGCFYIQSYDAVFNVEKIDLEKYPPDLVIEVDVTSPSIDRFPIYALLGVPEIWRYAKEQVKIHLLQGKKYIETAESRALPPVTGEILTRFLTQSQTEKRSVWLKKLREWIRSTNTNP